MAATRNRVLEPEMKDDCRNGTRTLRPRTGPYSLNCGYCGELILLLPDTLQAVVAYSNTWKRRPKYCYNKNITILSPLIETQLVVSTTLKY